MNMDFISIDSLLNIVGLFASGGIGGFCVWKWQARKAKAEAQEAEVHMAQQVQETYQKMLADKQGEVDDKNRIINELREDRDHFRQDRNELRERLDNMDKNVRTLQDRVAENTREMGLMRPFLCGVIGCKLRQPVATLGKEVNSKKSRKKQTDPLHGIAPNTGNVF